MEPSILRIAAGSDATRPHQVTLTYQCGDKHVDATSNIVRLLAPEEEESIRWYLEEYRKFPFEPASTIARNTAALLRAVGERLFDYMFNGSGESRDLWTLVEGQLETTRVEIAAAASRFAVPWEVLWNPLDVMPVACRAASF